MELSRRSSGLMEKVMSSMETWRWKKLIKGQGLDTMEHSLGM